MFSSRLKVYGPWVALVVLSAAAYAANVIISPNMGMPVPVVGSEPGPDWANDINASLSIIDSHDHSPGRGVQVTPQGLNISSDLSFISHNATALRSTRFTAQGSPLALPSDLGALYVSGVDLYYNDVSGNQVRITQGGNVTGATGTITGLPSGTASASFAASTFTFQSATNTPAIMNVGPLVIGTNTVSPKTVTLAPPGGLAANYNLTLFNGLPGSTSLVTLDSSGNLVASDSLALPTILLADGSAASPSLTFAGDTDTGLYRVAANEIGMSVGGSVIAAFNSSTINLGFSAQTQFSNGSAATPSLSFASDPDTGLYRVAANEIGMSVGGSVIAAFNSSTTNLSFSQQVLVGNGSAPTPSLSFASDSNTGFYSAGADIIGITVGGTSVGSIQSGGISMATPISTSGKLTASGTCTRRTNTFSITGTVSCNAGEAVTGGGCDCGGLNVLQTYPDTSASWSCACAAAGTRTAYAICCTI